MEAAIDKIRDKFGADALQKGIALRRNLSADRRVAAAC